MAGYYVELVEAIKAIALLQNTVKSAKDGDVYDNWNSAEVKYGAFNIGLESMHHEGQQCTYTFILYYGDRLTQDRINRNEIWADGMVTLQTIVNALGSIDGIEVPEEVDYTPYEQKFMDYLAGVWCRVDVTIESLIGECGDYLNTEWRLGMPLPALLGGTALS